MRILLIAFIILPLYCLGQDKNVIVLESQPISFKDKLFSNFPIIQKRQDKFFIYDFVSEKLIVADEKLNLLKETIASRGISRTVADNKEVKLLYRNLYVGDKHIYLWGSTVQRYSHKLEKLPIDKLTMKSLNPNLKHLPVPDISFLVEEDKRINHYIVRVYTSSASNPDRLEVYTKDFYQRPMYAVFEKNIEDTTLTPIKRMIIPHDKIYQEKLPLGYTYSQTIVWGKKGKLIATEGASEKIRIYNTEGKEIEAFGEKGKYMGQKDTIPCILYQEDTNKIFWQKTEKLMQQMALKNPIYGQAYYDAQTDKIYREYSPSVREGESRKRYMQVYQKKKLIADVPFPLEQKIISIENDIIWAYKVNPDGETPPQFIDKLKIQ